MTSALLKELDKLKQNKKQEAPTEDKESIQKTKQDIQRLSKKL